MTKMMTLAVCMGVGLATLAGAQGPVAPRVDAKTPADCTKQLNDWRTAQLTPASAAVQHASPETRDDLAAKYSKLYSAVAAETKRAGTECAAQFSIDRLPPEQLIELAGLYNFVGDTASRRRATEHLLATKDLAPRVRGRALGLAVNAEISAAGDHFGIIDGAERVVSEIDALPDSLDDVKLAAHVTMMNRYEYLDVDDGLRKHATMVVDLGRRLHNPSAMVNAYLSVARSYADLLHPDSALAALDGAEQELGSAMVSRQFADFRQRYALIGTKAAAIDGKWWLNAGDETSTVQPGNGTVTFVEFTAHWCGPCKNSYPGVRSLATRFAGKPFQGVMVTSLYGFLGTAKNLTPDQEVAADRDYFTKEHSIPYKVAINVMPKAAPGMAQPDVDYRVGGIPQIILVDKHGVIRQIITGWDSGNTARIGNYIQQMLTEP